MSGPRRSGKTGLDGPLRLLVLCAKAKLGKRTGNCKAVLLVIAGHANPNGTGARPGLRSLAQCAGLSVDATVAAIERLEVLGVLSVSRSIGGRRRPNSYTIILGALEALLPDRTQTLGGTDRFPEAKPAQNVPDGRASQSAAPSANDRSGGANHNHPSEPVNTTPMAPAGSSLVESGMDAMAGGRTLGDRGAMLDALRRAGVDGPNRDRLADCSLLTPAIVDAEAKDVAHDATVVSPGSVVANRLAKRAGIDLRESRRSRLGPELAAGVGRLEVICRNRRAR